MLWRAPHETEVRYQSDLSRLSGTHLDGSASSPEALWASVVSIGVVGFADLEIWRRLIQRDFGDPNWVEFGFLEATKEDAKEVIPPSLWSRTLLWTCPDEEWRSLPLGQAVAVIWSADGKPALVMLGRPTESAWDQFKATLESEHQVKPQQSN